MLAILLVGRFLAASLLFGAGITKLANPPGISPVRIPRVIASRWRFLVRIVAILEIILAIAVVLPSTSPYWLLAGVIALGMVLTGYGVMALRTTGSCGCGIASEPSTVWHLIGRNLLLFGIIVGGVAGDRNSVGRWESNNMVIALVCAMPMAILVLTAVHRQSPLGLRTSPLRVWELPDDLRSNQSTR